MKQDPIISTMLTFFSMLFLGIFVIYFFRPLAMLGLSDRNSYLLKLVIVWIGLFSSLWCMEWSYFGKQDRRVSAYSLAIVPVQSVLRIYGLGIEVLIGYFLLICLISWIFWKYARRYYVASHVLTFVSLLFFGSLFEAEYSQALIWQYSIPYLLGCLIVVILFFKIGKRYLRLDEIR